MKNAADGARAEDLAAAFLERQGLRVVARNYRCRLGEIDLVLADGPALVFAEVRYRSSAAFGGAAASVTRAKRERIVAAASHFLAGKPERPCRFDVVVLDRLAPDAVQWIRDAFAA
ncbi:MAG: YraN family protein [Burkholderiales bacterium]|nr:YraN family protein [Burkholderiales bacterium]